VLSKFLIQFAKLDFNLAEEGEKDISFGTALDKFSLQKAGRGISAILTK